MKKWKTKVRVSGELYDVVEHSDAECSAPRLDGKVLAPFSHGFVCLYRDGVYEKWCGVSYAERAVINCEEK